MDYIEQINTMRIQQEPVAALVTSLPAQCYKQRNGATIKSEQVTDTIALEIAVAIVVNGITLTVLMASPEHLEWLALGFLCSEGLIHHARDCQDIEIVGNTETGYEVHVQVSHQVRHQLKMRQRQQLGATGCGLCGVTALEYALPHLDPLTYDHATSSTGLRPRFDSIQQQLQHLSQWQRRQAYSGALHAASLQYGSSQEGWHYYVCEDVGRHNALDKILGYRLEQKRSVGGTSSLFAEGVVMTSRLSVDLVQKAIRARLNWLAGISAPTALAIKLASQCNLTLIGFAREGRMTVYAGCLEDT